MVGNSLLTLGRYENPADHRMVQHLDGRLDDVAIYNRALTAAEILRDMRQGIDVSQPGLVGAWTFDEGAGLAAHDSTDNHNDGVLGNGGFGEGHPGEAPKWNSEPGAIAFTAASDQQVQQPEWRLAAI